jgi:hypothetical protein
MAHFLPRGSRPGPHLHARGPLNMCLSLLTCIAPAERPHPRPSKMNPSQRFVTVARLTPSTPFSGGGGLISTAPPPVTSLGAAVPPLAMQPSAGFFLCRRCASSLDPDDRNLLKLGQDLVSDRTWLSPQGPCTPPRMAHGMASGLFACARRALGLPSRGRSWS